MVFYNYDSNSIITEPLKSHSKHELVCAHYALHTHLSNRGLTPHFQILDNKCPDGLKKFMQNTGVTFQLVPPHLHRTNAAERAITTYRDHLIAGISSCDSSFLLHLWDRLIPQATLTINLLQPPLINPRLSAEAHLNEAFNLNCPPLTPPGT